MLTATALSLAALALSLTLAATESARLVQHGPEATLGWQALGHLAWVLALAPAVICGALALVRGFRRRARP